MMRNLLIFSLLIIVAACSQPKGYQIEVAIEGATGSIRLEQRESGAFVVKDSAEVVDGKAVLKGEVQFPDVYFITAEGLNQRGLIFVENTKFKVSGHIDSMRTLRVTGSPLNDEYFLIKSELDKHSDTGMAKYRDYQMAVQAGDMENAPRLMEEVRAIFAEQEKKMEDFIRNNPASWVTPFILGQVQQSKEPDELEAILNLLDPKLDVVPNIKMAKERVEKMKHLAIGQIAPDFTQNDPDGNPVRLSDVYSKNEYTLIDFWAAWCGPCRAENPNVVAVFNEFKSKGFSVFGVSLDRTKEDWLKAIKDDKLDWPHVSDLKYWQNEAAALYAVNSIPANYLVDRQGKIVAKNLREAALREKIAELLP